MSRGKLRNAIEVCADCGAHDPTWASLNKAIEICDECCSVHRSLGRNVSQVKSLKKDSWSPTQFTMVHTLYNNGANSVWEHTLLEAANAKSGRWKPNPKDSVHPTKAEFIRAKHQMHSFVYRPLKEEDLESQDEINKQLHSNVRTANLETSLQLLAQGADPNYFHPEKGTKPVHMAAKTGQMSQVELLTVYGADPGAYDWEGKTPADYARTSGYSELADRLVELQYEVTDRLAYYVCGKKPDHQSGHHFIVPEMADSLDQMAHTQIAKKKLQGLTNRLFEELAMDVYDEVDRRHTDSVWLSTQNSSTLVTDRCTVPFLPVNPEYSSTRNQGRQKLARFNAREFTALIIDVLSEAKRRQLGLSTTASALHEKHSEIKLLGAPRNLVMAQRRVQSQPQSTSTKCNLLLGEGYLSDEEPLYDSVASDDESLQEHNLAVSSKLLLGSRSQGSLASESSSASQATQNQNGHNISARIKQSEESDQKLRRQLPILQSTLQQLYQQTKDKDQEILALRNMIQKLIQENTTLRMSMQGLCSPAHHSMPNGHDNQQAISMEGQSRSPRGSPRGSQRPQSMYEPREQQRQVQQPLQQQLQQNPQQQWNTVPVTGVYGMFARRSDGSTIGVPYGNMGNSSPHAYEPEGNHEPLPSQYEVNSKTEQVTRCIQELLISAQEGKHGCYLSCVEKIYAAVLEMASIFPAASNLFRFTC